MAGGKLYRSRTRKSGRKGKLNKTQVTQVKRIINSATPMGETNESLDITASQTPGGFRQMCQIWHDASTAKPAGVKVTRDNNVIRLGRMSLRGSVQLGDSANVVRVILFVWKGATGGVAPNMGNVLDLVDNDGVTISASHYVYAPINKIGDSASPAPVIISDRIYNIDSVSKNQILFHIKHDFKGMKIAYRGLGATDIGERSLYLMCLSDSSAVAHPTVHGQFQVKFNS